MGKTGKASIIFDKDIYIVEKASVVLRVCSTSLKSLTRSCNGLYPASTRGTVRNAFGFPIVFFSFGFVGVMVISCL